MIGGEVSSGRKLRTGAAVVLGGVVLLMILTNHVWRDRPPTVLDVILYCVLIGIALVVFDRKAFLDVSREARKHSPWAKQTQVGIPRPPTSRITQQKEEDSQ